MPTFPLAPKGGIIMRLEVGHIVKTSYGTGPYLIVDIRRNCTCTEYVTSLDYPMGEGPPSPPHMHLTCEFLQGEMQGKKAWLSGYDEELKNVWNSSKLTVIPNERAVQISMDFGKSNALGVKNGGPQTPSFTIDDRNAASNLTARHVSRSELRS